MKVLGPVPPGVFNGLSHTTISIYDDESKHHYSHVLAAILDNKVMT